MASHYRGHGLFKYTSVVDKCIRWCLGLSHKISDILILSYTIIYVQCRGRLYLKKGSWLSMHLSAYEMFCSIWHYMNLNYQTFRFIYTYLDYLTGGYGACETELRLKGTAKGPAIFEFTACTKQNHALLLYHALTTMNQYTTIKSGILCTGEKPGPRLNIKTVLSTYGDFHVKDKTAVRTSYL